MMVAEYRVLLVHNTYHVISILVVNDNLKTHILTITIYVVYCNSDDVATENVGTYICMRQTYLYTESIWTFVW